MKHPDRISVLIYGSAAHLAWCTTGATETMLTDRFFVTEPEKLAEVLRGNQPEIALVACENVSLCSNIVALCRRANPGIQIIVIKSNDSFSAIEGEVHDNIFAVVADDSDNVELIAVMKKAIAFVRQRRQLQEKSESRSLRRHYPAHWLMSQESEARDSKLDFAASLIRNILHTASQGLGIGAVLTYVDLLQMTLPQGQLQQGNEAFAALVRNAQAARQWLNAFENILRGLQKKYQREVVRASDLLQVIESAARNAEHFREIKGQVLDVASAEFSGAVYGNHEALPEILGEMLLNAYKYSPPGSKVRIVPYATAEFCAITVVNEIEKMGGGISGIPPEYEEKVFEPFFRLNNTWDDRYREQKFGLGIGLTLAEHAAQQCGGRLYLYEVKVPADEAGGTEENRIIAELMLARVMDS